MERTLLDARDRSAAGPDLEDVHHGDLHRQRLIVAADERHAGGQRLAVVDHAGLGGGTAHIESDGIAYANCMAKRLGADDAGRRAGFQHAHALELRMIERLPRNPRSPRLALRLFT